MHERTAPTSPLAVASASPGVTVGQLIRVTFRDSDGDAKSIYTGTVTAADSHGVDLRDVQAFDLLLVHELGQPSGWYEIPEVGVAWPRRGDVHVYEACSSDCMGSCCRDFS